MLAVGPLLRLLLLMRPGAPANDLVNRMSLGVGVRRFLRVDNIDASCPAAWPALLINLSIDRGVGLERSGSWG